MLIVIFFIYRIEISVEYANSKSKMAVTVTSYLTVLFYLRHLNCRMGYHHKYEMSPILLGLKVYLGPIFLD